MDMLADTAPLPSATDLLKALTVLYVEDDDDVRELLTRFLKRRVGTLHVGKNGQEGIELFRAHNPDVVITDIKMPVMDGLEMAGNIKNSAQETPVIVVTAFSERDYFMQAIKIGVDCYVTKPVDTEILLQAIARSAMARFQQRELNKARHTLLDALTNTIAVLSRAIEMRDPYTDGHQKRVSQLAAAIAAEMGLPAERITGVKFGALIHDVGKMGIPAELLTTSRKLTPQELAIMRTHPASGADILSEADFPWPVRDMVMQHHERVDGSGYPAGLKGEEILLEARIIAVADVVESMASHRPYRPALGLEAGVAEISGQRGVLYDAQVVDACVRVIERAGSKLWEPETPQELLLAV
jgi:putative two-component system response regulator